MSARPYKIEAQPLAQRYARGWHCLGLARDYQDAIDYAEQPTPYDP